MSKKILLIFSILFLCFSCGIKDDPVYKEESSINYKRNIKIS